MPKMRLWWYWREFYEVNRQNWPDKPRRVAALDAFRLARRVK